MPIIGEWEIQLLTWYSLCIKEDGVSVSDLRIVFDASHIYDDYLFIETCIILSRVFNYNKE